MSVKKHTCNICNKDYKSPQSLWNHKNKIHIDIHQKSTNNIHDIDKLSTTNQNKQNINNKEPPKIKKTENTLCNYCNNNFSCYSSLHRHLKICKANMKYLICRIQLLLKTCMDWLIQQESQKK